MEDKDVVSLLKFPPFGSSSTSPTYSVAFCYFMSQALKPAKLYDMQTGIDGIFLGLHNDCRPSLRSRMRVSTQVEVPILSLDHPAKVNLHPSSHFAKIDP